MELFIFMIVVSLVVARLLFTQKLWNKQRLKAISGFVEPMGFDVMGKLDDTSASHLYNHQVRMGLSVNMKAACVADDGTTRIVAIECSLGEDSYEQYFLGIDPSISAPPLVIKRRTASTKSIWTASWGDVLYRLDFKDDPDFEEKFIVRGDIVQAREFLNADRRKALCEATYVPESFSVVSKSVLIKLANRIDEATFEDNVGKCLATMKLMMDKSIEDEADTEDGSRYHR
ncbi:MAG: hypothetical protein ACK5E3_08065 [Planctomycetota bacterium]|jgi:hypothetical protein